MALTSLAHVLFVHLMSRWDEYEGDECVSANLRPSAQESAQEMEREKGELLGM